MQKNISSQPRPYCVHIIPRGAQGRKRKDDPVSLCKKCRKEIVDGAPFCPWCGAKLIREKTRRRRPNGSGTVIKQKNGRYKAVGAVEIEGYTAEKLAEMSKYLNGDGAFMMLIELRENPKKAHERIAEGFKMK